MKAAMLTGIREIEVGEVPAPKIEAPGDVLVMVGMVGICGSDVHYYLRGGMSDTRIEYPWIVGHEAAGTVMEVGAEVTLVKPGDRVAIEPAVSCGECDQCLAGRSNTCRTIKFLSCAGELSGCLCEYVVVPQINCFPVNDSMPLEHAALSEPLSICLYAVNQSAATPGSSVAILGAGPIGLGVLLCARAAGCEKLYVTDKIDARLDAARGAGACWTGNTQETDISAEIRKLESEQLDVVFECCGDQEALDQAVELLKPGGKLMILGVPDGDRISFNAGMCRRKEITVNFVRRQVDCVETALALIEGGKIDVDFMLTHRLALEETGKAFDLLADYKDGVIKVVVEIGQ